MVMTCFSCLFKSRSDSQQLSIQGIFNIWLQSCASSTSIKHWSSCFVSGIDGIENIKLYSYSELRRATDDFSPGNKIGEGGFGYVYKVSGHLTPDIYQIT